MTKVLQPSESGKSDETGEEWGRTEGRLKEGRKKAGKKGGKGKEMKESEREKYIRG